jgi:hypothetical protein
MFLLILLDVEGFYFYFLMLKVIVFTFGCSKFLLLVLNVESFCSYFCYFYVIRLNFHYVSIHQHQNYVHKV